MVPRSDERGEDDQVRLWIRDNILVVAIAALVSVILIAQIALAGGGTQEGTITLSKAELKQLIQREVAGSAAKAAKKKSKRGPAGPQGPAGPAGLAGSPDAGAQILSKLAPVDGSGSGLDADALDGISSATFATRGTEAWHELGPAGSGNCLAGEVFCGESPGFNTCQWQNYGGASTGAYLRDPSGFVHLKGAVIKADGTFGTCTLSEEIFGLPPGYTPELPEYFATLAQDAFGAIGVNSFGGVVRWVGGPSKWISLDGISFRCSPSGIDGCP